MAVDGWKEAKLGDVAKQGKGMFVDGPFGSNLKTSDYTNDGIRLIQLQNIGEGSFSNKNVKYTSPEKLEELKRHTAIAGDIVLAKMAEPVARACIIPDIEDIWIIVADCIRLRVNKGEYDADFIQYLINSASVRRQAEARSTGTTRKRISLTTAKSLNVDLPPLPEQKKIAGILGSVDEAIAKTEAVIAQTQRVKQGLLQTLLTRGIGHTKFKQTELGEIPESWKIKPIGDMVEFSNGKAHEKDIDETGEYVVVNSKFISTEGKVRKFSHSLNLPAHINDILIVMSDIPNGKAIAKCFLTDMDNTYTVNQRIGRLRSKRDNPSFLYYVLNRNPYFLSFDDGVKQTNLRKDEVLACPVAVPTDTQEQDGIVNILDDVGETISCNINKLAKLKTLKKGLMADLLTGRVRVNVDQSQEDAA